MTQQPPSWATALAHLSIDGSHLSAEDLVDACLLLALGERVHVIAGDRLAKAPLLLVRHLRDLGYAAGALHHEGSRVVAASDVVVLFAGPAPRADRATLRRAGATGAIRIAITTHDDPQIVAWADVALALPPVRTSDQPLGRMIFDLLASMVVEAISREVGSRVDRSAGLRGRTHPDGARTAPALAFGAGAT